MKKLCSLTATLLMCAMISTALPQTVHAETIDTIHCEFFEESVVAEINYPIGRCQSIANAPDLSGENP